MTELDVISRRDAIKLGLKKYFTGKPCPSGHLSEKYCSNRVCLDCVRDGASSWRANNPEKKSKSYAEWARKNIALVRKNTSSRRCRKNMATPKWLSENQKNEIKLVYELALSLEIKTGVRHQVDHIIPLKGENVSGLHVPWNLRAVSASENLKKGNKVCDRA